MIRLRLSETSMTPARRVGRQSRVVACSKCPIEAISPTSFSSTAGRRAMNGSASHRFTFSPVSAT
eukprot:617979-Pleurochrysis_carterae.AAC.1